MSIIKCKMCGGDLEITAGMTVAECEYCGSKQTIPSADNEKKLTLFSRANRLRFGCEFDKAAGVYEALVADFPQEAEAYWGLVLCKYGIEYVDDPATGKKIPTCHRSSFESVLEDSDFEQTLENADVIARRVYREEAKEIEEVRKGIIEVSSREEPYDIFLCYKETDENGERTLDSVLAQDVYDVLTQKGYRVFFSRITLEDKLGQEYEPYIFAALNSARIMLVFGTDYERFNAVWVKNEWSRYLQLMTRDKTKHLIPCYKDIDAYDMPKAFAKLQAQDLGKVGALQDLLRGIDKLLTVREIKPKTTVVSRGMTQQEKNRMDAMQRSQKRTQAVLVSVILGVVVGALSAFLTMIPFFDTIAYTGEGVITWSGSPRWLAFMFHYGMAGFSLGWIVTCGLRSPAAHWLSMAMGIWAVVRLWLVQFFDYQPCASLAVLLVIFWLLALLTGLAVCRDKKKARNTRLILLGVMLLLGIVPLL